MAEGSIIGIGKGNEEWNNSAPHGAGRLMSRGDAKRKIDIEAYRRSMKGVWSSCVSKDTLDEAPQAYKKAETILKYIEPSVEVITTMKPVYNFKA